MPLNGSDSNDMPQQQSLLSTAYNGISGSGYLHSSRRGRGLTQSPATNTRSPDQQMATEASHVSYPVQGSKKGKKHYLLLPKVLEPWSALVYSDRFDFVVDKLKELVINDPKRRDRAKFIVYEFHMCGITAANAIPSVLIRT